MIDPWDELLHAVGQGWPHYKKAARPLIGQQKTKTDNKWLYLILAMAVLQKRA